MDVGFGCDKPLQCHTWERPWTQWMRCCCCCCCFGKYDQAFLMWLSCECVSVCVQGEAQAGRRWWLLLKKTERIRIEACRRSAALWPALACPCVCVYVQGGSPGWKEKGGGCCWRGWRVSPESRIDPLYQDGSMQRAQSRRSVLLFYECVCADLAFNMTCHCSAKSGCWGFFYISKQCNASGDLLCKAVHVLRKGSIPCLWFTVQCKTQLARSVALHSE